MPRMNGFEFGREIRKIDDNVKICFLIAGVPSKIRFDTLCVQEEGVYQDKFIKLLQYIMVNSGLDLDIQLLI
jgi:hypothetical protein